MIIRTEMRRTPDQRTGYSHVTFVFRGLQIGLRFVSKLERFTISVTRRWELLPTACEQASSNGKGAAFKVSVLFKKVVRTPEFEL